MQLHLETHRSTSPLPPDQVQPTSSSTHVHAAGLHSRHHHHYHDELHSQLRSKSPIPGPIQTSDHRHAGEQTTSPIRLSFDERPSRQSTQIRPQKRHSSTSSTISFSNSSSNINNSRKSTSGSGFTSGSGSSSNKRLSGTVQHRGRHANDWLFGGFSLRDQVAKLWRDREDASDEDDEGRDDGRGR